MIKKRILRTFYRLKDLVLGDSNRIIAFLTAAIVLVSVLQWNALKQSDKTIRQSERAFVFINGYAIFPQQVDGSDKIWYFVPQAENNGSTQTVGLIYNETCKIGAHQPESGNATRMIGPKQVTGVGACVAREKDLVDIWSDGNKITNTIVVFYRDVFGDSHISSYCRHITIKSDPRKMGAGGTIANLQEQCPERPDCADKECFR